VGEWDDDVPTCDHGIPHACTCHTCEEVWLNLCLWGELLDEA